MSQALDLRFKTREEWRDWLHRNHLKAHEAWVILYKKKSKTHGLQYSEAVEEAICYGWIDSRMSRLDEDTYRQRFTPRRKNSTWSRSNRELAARLMNSGKMSKSGCDAIEEGKHGGIWD